MNVNSKATRFARPGRISTLALTVVAMGAAQSRYTTLELSGESAPSGRTAQVTVHLTSPHSGAFRLTGAWMAADGAALFGNGEAFGTAAQKGGSIDVNFVGENPLLAVNFTAGDEPGRVKLGGGLSIRNVIPGGGMLPAGALVTLQGAGFRPDTRVKLTGVSDTEVSYINPTEIQIALPAPAMMDGLRITAKNPDESVAEYVSYWRGVPQGESADPLLARAIPLFSTKTALLAVLPGQVLTRIDSNYVLGLALQNPGLASAEITVGLESGGLVRIALPPGARISRELGELFGTAPPAGAAVFVHSSHPIQVLGLLGDRRGGTVLPVALAIE